MGGRVGSRSSIRLKTQDRKGNVESMAGRKFVEAVNTLFGKSYDYTQRGELKCFKFLVSTNAKPLKPYRNVSNPLAYRLFRDLKKYALLACDEVPGLSKRQFDRLNRQKKVVMEKTRQWIATLGKNESIECPTGGCGLC